MFGRKPVSHKSRQEKSGSSSTTGGSKPSLSILPAHEALQVETGTLMEDEMHPRDGHSLARAARPPAPMKSPSYQASMAQGHKHVSTSDRVYEHLDRDNSGRCQKCGSLHYVSESESDRDKVNPRDRYYDDRPSQRNGGRTLAQRGREWWAARDSHYADDQAYYDERDKIDEAKIHSLQHEIRKLKSEHKSQVQELLKQMQAEREKAGEVKESVNKMVTVMENKDLFLGRQATDDQVKTQFLKLMKQITTWSVPFAQAKAAPADSTLAAISLYDLQKIVPHITEDKRFLSNLSHVRLFVRGFVSLSIAEMLFRSPTSNFVVQDIWMDKETAASMDEIERKLYQADSKVISYRELNDWRALTTNLISRLNTTSKSGKGMEGHITECARRILEVIMPLAPTGSHEDLSHKLEDILLEAVSLAQTLRHQRAAWSIRHPLPAGSVPPGAPILLDESVMQDELENDDSDEDLPKVPVRNRVDVFVMPALFKRGNSDGEQFDVETCSVRAKVRSSPPVNPAQAPAQKYARQPVPR